MICAYLLNVAYISIFALKMAEFLLLIIRPKLIQKNKVDFWRENSKVTNISLSIRFWQIWFKYLSYQLDQSLVQVENAKFTLLGVNKHHTL